MIKRKCCKRIKKDYQTKNLKNPFFRKKTKEKKTKSFLTFKIFLIIFLVLLAFWFIFIFSFWQVKNIEVKGSDRIKPQSIRELINEQLEKKSLFILRQNNIFLFKKKSAKEMIKEEFNLTDIKIKKKLQNTLIVEIKERPYSYIFCESGEYYFSSDDSYLMEKIAFEGSEENLLREGGEGLAEIDNELDTCVVSLEEKDKYFIIENKNNNSIIKSGGKIALSREYLDFIARLNEKLKEHPEFNVDRLIVADQYFNSIFVKIKDGPQIYFNVNTDIDLQLENLILVKNNKIKDNFNKLEYIDLRYGDTVYFFPENINN